LEICELAQRDLKIDSADIYSLDFAYCTDDARWYLIELNSAPGIRFPNEDKHYQYAFFQDLADYMSQLIEENRANSFSPKFDTITASSVFLERHTQPVKRKKKAK